MNHITRQWVIGCLSIILMGAGIINVGRVKRIKKNRDFWKESAQYNRKQVSKWKHRTRLLEDTFGIGTKPNPAEGL